MCVPFGCLKTHTPTPFQTAMTYSKWQKPQHQHNGCKNGEMKKREKLKCILISGKINDVSQKWFRTNLC